MTDASSATIEPQPEVADRNQWVSVGYWELVRDNVDFRWLWFGQIVSLLGDWFNLIASVALLTALSESGLAVGSLFVVRMLAPFLTSPLAGAAADRFSRRNILIVADVLRGLVVLGMLFVRSTETVWLLYLLTALQMGLSSFFFTARNALLPDVVDERSLGTANAIASATWSVMLALGAALGGFAAGWLGIYAAFSIDSVTFFVSAVLIWQVGQRAAPRDAEPSSVVQMLREYVHGLRYLRAHPDLLAIALHKAALTMLLGSTFRVVQSVIAEQVFPIGQQGGISMGFLFAAAGVGTGVGPIVARYFTGDRDGQLRWAIVGGYLLGASGVAMTASLQSFLVVLVGGFLGGVGNGILWVFSTQLLMQSVAADVRGRVFGTEFALFTLASAASSATVGVALDSWLSISAILIIMATLAILPAVAWSLWLLLAWRPKQREFHRADCVNESPGELRTNGGREN